MIVNSGHNTSLTYVTQHLFVVVVVVVLIVVIAVLVQTTYLKRP